MNITLVILFVLLGTVIMFKPSYVVGIEVCEEEKTVFLYHYELPYAQALFEFFHSDGHKIIVNRRDYEECVKMMEKEVEKRCHN